MVLSLLIFGFSLNELLPFFNRIRIDNRYIPLGGILSGFFGGISGHQGALRTAFLINCGLTKEAFIGTVVVSAVIVDISRLTTYGVTYFSGHFEILKDSGIAGLVAVGTIAAFAGSFIGSRLVKKITMRSIQILVGLLLLLVSLLLGTGII